MCQALPAALQRRPESLVVAADLPPAELLMRALREPPPAVVQPLARVSTINEQGKRAMLEVAEGSVKKAKASIAVLNRALDALSATPPETPEEYDEFIAASELGIEAYRSAAVSLDANIRAQMLKARAAGVDGLFRRIAKTLRQAHFAKHDALVEAYYRLLALRAEVDPEAREIIFASSEPREIAEFLGKLA